MNGSIKLRVVVTVLFGSSAVNVQAGWTPIDTFDSYRIGDSIDTQWNGHGTWNSAVDFDYFKIVDDPLNASNKVLAALEFMEPEAVDRHIILNDPRVNVEDGTSATLYLRFYRANQETHINFGLSDVETPTTWSDFEAQFRDQTAVGYARDGGDFAQFDNISELPENEWIHYWLVINNSSDTSEYYLQSKQAIPTRTKMNAGGRDVFDFRNGTDEPLTTFWLRTTNFGGTNHVGPWYLDDIYLDLKGENLTIPTLNDYNGNGQLDAGDLDLQAAAIKSQDTRFDLDKDGDVDFGDRTKWVKEVKKTWIGDANLDGEFNSGDLVSAFVLAKFEQDVDATWTDGDFNGDMRFNTGDFVAAFTDGGYEKGPLTAVAAVPEPSGIGVALLAAILFVLARRPVACQATAASLVGSCPWTREFTCG